MECKLYYNISEQRFSRKGRGWAEPFIVDFRITWTFLNSINASDEHSHWYRLTAYATKMSIYFSDLL